MRSNETSIIGEYAYPISIRDSLKIFVMAALFCYVYADTAKWLWHYWLIEKNWQFVVPIAFVYMLWDRRDLYAGLKRKPNILWGGMLLSLACAMLIIGQVSSTQTVREVSVVVSIFALVLLFFGTKYVVTLFWPLVYLVLMTSLPSDLLETLRYPLRQISAAVAEDILRFAGYAVFRDGTALQLPHTTLEVADSCSGLNQLISSIALGIPIAFVMLNQWWKRVTILLLSVVFGLIMNWFRVFLISVWHYSSAKETVHGPYGIYELPFIFLIGVFLTFIVAIFMADERGVRRQTRQMGSMSTNDRVGGSKHSAAFLSATLVLATTALYLQFWKVEPVKLRGGLTDFPLTIAEFQGKPISDLEDPFYSDLAHDELMLEYVNPLGIKAKVYVGYFHSQNQQEEVIDYRYNWLHDGANRIDLSDSSVQIQMKKRRVKTETGTVTVYFCYDINGRNLIDPVKVKLASLADALIRRRSNGAIIIIQIDEDSASRTPEVEEFIKQIVTTSQANLRAENKY